MATWTLSRRARLVLAAGTAVLLAPRAPTALAQPQTRDQRACTGAMNGALASMTRAAVGEALGCVRDASKGKLATTIEACIVADAKGKVAKAGAKAAGDFGKRCTGTSRNPAGVPRKPPWGVTDATTVRGAGVDGPRALLHDVLGPDLDIGVLREAAGKDAARCQQQVAKELRGCHATLLREFNRCKKSGLASKAAPFDDGSDLAACFGADPKGTIAKRCDLRVERRPGRFDLDPLRKALGTRGIDRGVDLVRALPACAAGDVEGAHACLERAARCRSCLALDAADALGLDCDPLDDGAANGSCGAALGTFACEIDPESGFLFESGAGFLGGTLAGAIEIGCGAVEPTSGAAPCACRLTGAAPVEVPGRGWACITPVDACAAGTIDCDGGAALDFAISADHDVGVCSGNADCAAQCGASCAASGAQLWDSGCEGFCEGGAADGGACASDAQCPGGRCNGVEGGAHGTVCQCQCIALDRGTSAPGGLRCELGMRLRVEAALPCDGADVLLDVGERCLPVTTAGASASLADQDHVAGRMLPGGSDEIGGQALACEVLRTAGASGVVLVSAANAFDVPLAGDVYLLLALGCE
ncbi:MAG: hypothetical protein AB1689_13160 [Thermodesulfobacteriota bacterium]